MRQDDELAVRRLRGELAPMRDLWPDFAVGLHAMGFTTLAALVGRDAEVLPHDYCRVTARPADAVVRACFSAIVGFAETGVPIPIWRVLRDDAIRDQHQATARAHVG